MIIKKNIKRLWIVSICISLSSLSISSIAKAASKLLVLNYAISGDTDPVYYGDDHAVRVKTAAQYLREELKSKNEYTVLTSASDLAAINQWEQEHNVLNCNGCELRLGRKLGADIVLVPWVYRVSNLVLTMYIELRDVETRSVLSRSTLSFRGDNDESWQRAIDYYVDHKMPNTAN